MVEITFKTLFVSKFQEAQAMTRVESTPFMTSSPRKNKLPPPRHPLENRNSAPDIVVTGTTGKSLKILPIGQFFERFFFFYSHFNYSGVYNC